MSAIAYVLPSLVLSQLMASCLGQYVGGGTGVAGGLAEMEGASAMGIGTGGQPGGYGIGSRQSYSGEMVLGGIYGQPIVYGCGTGPGLSYNGGIGSGMGYYNSVPGPRLGYSDGTNSGLGYVCGCAPGLGYGGGSVPGTGYEGDFTPVVGYGSGTGMVGSSMMAANVGYDSGPTIGGFTDIPTSGNYIGQRPYYPTANSPLNAGPTVLSPEQPAVLSDNENSNTNININNNMGKRRGGRLGGLLGFPQG